MAVARFKKVCMDATEPSRLGPFWAQILNLGWEPDDKGEGGLFGPTRQPTIWLNIVPEPKTVKHRVHLDLHAASLAELEALGSSVVLPEGADRHWTVMADLEGGEYCAFVRADPPPNRLHGLVVDSVDAAAQARWWARLFGGSVVDEEGYSFVENVAGVEFTMGFVRVAEAKTVKNRIHWDVGVSDPQPLIDAGATVLRPPGGDISWYVMADPEGNEFCAFVDEPARRGMSSA